RGIDLDRWCWLRKRAAWRRPIHLVAPSQWMAACVQRSALMHDWPVQVIPNALPTQIYRPWPRVLARQLFDLPQEVPLLLFAAVGGGHDPRKGWDLLQHALSLLVDRLPGLEAVVCGQSEPPAPPRLGLPIHYIGYLHDDQAMALLYSAADVMVVPSRMEAFGQAASEAHSCGVPVVAFDGTGLNDVVQHRHTGYLAAAGDPVDLAAGVAWVLDAEQADRRSRLAQQARQRAEQRWSAAVVARQHAALYAQVLHR
ncbi:MAG: glycosyltransferase, partial [Cyanobacteria bacterium M_surface_7_m2_040]|nr:glycosyltransferase [Cyanobacteria bacterium M_surface_7_m2_040]